MNLSINAAAPVTAANGYSLILLAPLFLVVVVIIILIIFSAMKRAKNPLPSSKPQGSVGYGILGFFIPLAGFIIFLVWREKEPGNSKVSGIGALIGVIFWTIVPIIVYFALLQSLLH